MRSDIVGKKFNRLTVLKRVSQIGEKNSKWECLCECGNKTIVIRGNIVSGSTKSCGCLKEETKGEQLSNLTESLKRTHVDGTSLPMIKSGLPKNNTSGVKGVSFDKRRKRWIAQIKFRQRNIFLGSFKNKQDAINARKEAEEKYFAPILEKHNETKKSS